MFEEYDEAAELPSIPVGGVFEAIDDGVVAPGVVLAGELGFTTLLAIALGAYLFAGLVGVVVSLPPASLSASGWRENQLGIFQPPMLLQPVEQLITAKEKIRPE